MGLRLPKTRGMLRREAARWLARLQSGRDPNVEQKFRRWHDANPAHADAFDRVRRSYEQAGLLRSSAIVSPRNSDAHQQAAERRPRYAIAAAAALAVLVPAGALFVDGLPFTDTRAMMLATKVGEIRQVSLRDGSKVTLDTATSVKVEIGRSERRALLEHGRVRFQVADAQEPFVIDAGSLKVTAGAGVFDVERAGQQSRVDVLAGEADVRTLGETEAELNLDAGEGVATLPSGIERKQVASTPDWTRGMLQFDGTPLGAAVALANRYSDRRIIVHGDLAELRVTGAFRAGDTAGLARALAAAFNLSLGQTPNGNFLLSPSSPSAEQ